MTVHQVTVADLQDQLADAEGDLRIAQARRQALTAGEADELAVAIADEEIARAARAVERCRRALQEALTG